MILNEYWLWFLYVFIIILFVFISFFITYRMIHPAEREKLSICIIFISISLCFISILTPPFDIYLLKISTDIKWKSNSSILRIIYFILFFQLILLSFIFIPFGYFYSKEYSRRPLLGSQKYSERIKNALKKTFIFLFIVFILLLIGVLITIFKYNKPNHTTTTNNNMKTSILFDLLLSLRFTIGFIILMGFILWISITSRALAALPIRCFIIYSNYVSEKEKKDYLNELDHQTVIIQQKRDEILRTYAEALRNQMEKEKIDQIKQQMINDHLFKTIHDLKDNQINIEKENITFSLADKHRLLQLKKNENDLQQLRHEFLRSSTKEKWYFLICKCHILRYPIGFLLFNISFIYIISIFITSLDKIIYSNYQNGFILKERTLFNPMDYILVQSSNYFPLDYIIFGLFMLFLFGISIEHLHVKGWKLLFYRIKPLYEERSPCMVLLVILCLIYICFMMLISLVTFAPEYTTFGQQELKIENNKKIPCRINDFNQIDNNINASCRISIISEFIISFCQGVPIFGLCTFIGNLLFSLSFFPWMIYTYINRDNMNSTRISRIKRNDMKSNMDPTLERLLVTNETEAFI